MTSKTLFLSMVANNNLNTVLDQELNSKTKAMFLGLANTNQKSRFTPKLAELWPETCTAQ